MISAKEAREQTLESMNKYEKAMFKSIDKHIKRATKRSDFRIYVYENLTTEIINKLKELKYNVQYYNGLHGVYYSISWDKE